ncbi:MAG: hypothetical protein J7K68_03030 [Candidatus Diapherotrites archaeon]|nr:hypothetical protein [Candidatus Diapherotrites archaeon]
MKYKGQITMEAIIAIAVVVALVYVLLFAQTNMFSTIKEKNLNEKFSRIEMNSADIVIETYGENRHIDVKCKSCVSYRRWFI